ncbi:MAG TPA: NADH-quinone oxidoreductase subunit N [Anaerolineae bacterium]|nr:NADH-quinone oxidoreductase subunit N [Anaerolineae bacterium]
MEISIPTLNFLVIAPEIVVLVTALLVMMVDLFLSKEQKGRLAWLSLIGVLAAAGVSYYIWDGTETTLQNMLAADDYALFLNLVILTTAALAILFSIEYTERVGLARGEYYTLLLLSTTGMMLMAAAINLMTIFLALEILSIALYVLVGLNRAELRSAEAALKYFLLGAFASGFLLYGMALIYGQAGTTSLAGLRDYVGSLGGEFPTLLMVGMGLIIVGFGFKVALVPFQMWTPDTYEGAPTSVTAFMSVGAKAAGFAALGRVLLYALNDLNADWVWVLAVLSALTMTVGNLTALRQTNLKRMLAYSSIAHAGYILVGVAADNALGTSGMLFYLFSYAFMNVGAFAILIAVGRFGGMAEGGETLDDLAGLAVRKPGLAAAMALFMLSLAGVPPLVGFLAKLYVFSAAVQAGMIWLAVFGVINSVISAYYYLRVVVVMFMKEGRPDGEAAAPVCLALQVGVGLAAVAIVVLGLWPAPILDLARMTAMALLGG